VCDKVVWVILGQTTTSSQSRPRGVAPKKSKESVFLSMAHYADDFLPVFTYTDLNDMTTEELHEMYKRHVRGLNEMRRNPDLYWADDIEVWECKVLQLMLFIDYGGTYIHPTRKRKRSAPNFYLEELKEKLKKMYRRLNYQ
jgi:hypothetical protein